MKKIKRTTIKIKKRELVLIKNGAETIQFCPLCHFPVQTNLAAQEANASEKFIECVSAKDKNAEQ